MFQEGQVVNHSTLGRGVVLWTEPSEKTGQEGYYANIQFDCDKDNKYKVRVFTEDTLKPFLVK